MKIPSISMPWPLRFRPAAIVVVLPLCLALLVAATGPGDRVGVIDVDRVRLESVTIQRDLNRASAPAAAIQERFKDKRNQLAGAVEQYRAQREVATEAVNRQRLEQIEKLKGEVEQLSSEYTQALTSAGRNELPWMRARIMDAIETVAAGRGIDVVLNADSVVYNDKGVDLSYAVIQHLDAE